MARARPTSAARARSAATRERLAEQATFGIELQRALGEPDRGIERALRLGLTAPNTVRELHTILAAARAHLDEARKLAERSRRERTPEAAQRWHLQSVAAEANASAYLAVAERADGFREIAQHFDDGVVSVAALDQQIREVARRSGKPRAILWGMTISEFAAALDAPWERRRKSEVCRLLDQDLRTLKRNGVVRDEPNSSDRSRYCLVRRSAIRPRQERP